MLEWMQKHKKYLVLTVWVSALALIFASMVEWGGGGFSAVSSDSVAKVGDIYISSQEYRRKYNELYDNLATFMREAGLPDDGKPIEELEQEAFRILVQEKLLIALANDMGVSVTPNEILATLLENPDFQDETHTFNAERYKSLLAQNGWTTERYESFVGDVLLQAKMQNFPIATLSTLETNAFATAAKIKDEVAIEILKRDSLLQNAVVEVTDSEVRSFWEKYKNNYMQPSRYKIAYIALDTGSMNIKEDVLEKFYKDNEKKYNASSFQQALAEVKQDYKKAIVALASSYMDGISKKLVATKDLQLQSSSVITTMDTNALTLLQQRFDSDLDISSITLDSIPLYSLELEDNGKDNSVLLLAVSNNDSHGLLSPLEYSDEHWIIPYVLEKTERELLSFEDAKEKVRDELLIKKENEEFKKMAYAKLSQINTESMRMLPISLTILQDKESVSYKQLSALGLNDDSIKEAIQQIMMSKKSDGLVFLEREKALLFKIVKQSMPDYADLINITNAEDEALKEMKIRDFRNALLDYASKKYKIIDYRRQN